MSMFADAEGREWRLRITGRVLRDMAEELGLKLGDLTRFIQGDDKPADSLPVTILFDALWVAVRGQHKGVDRNAFLDALGPAEFPQIMEAINASFRQAFPQEGDAILAKLAAAQPKEGAKEDDAPFADPTTSTS